MEISYFEDWFQKRLKIAKNIVTTFGKDAASDAEIILFCAASSLAAIVWPRTGTNKPGDKKRFVQLLIEYASAIHPPLDTISVDLLIRELLSRSRTDEANTLIKKFYHSEYAYFSKSSMHYYDDGPKDIQHAAGTLSRIYDPHQIDVTEEKILELAPNVLLRDIRKCSYANIIYSDLRSGLVHEYGPTGNVAQHGWNKSSDQLAYINHLIMPDEKDVKTFADEYKIEIQEARDALAQTRRRLYFPYEYIRDAIAVAANSLFAYWTSAPMLSRTEPTNWWIEGS